MGGNGQLFSGGREGGGALHEQFVLAHDAIEQENRRAAFYQRVIEGRNNLARVLKECKSGHSPEEVSACKMTIEWANKGILFTDLPDEAPGQLAAAFRVFSQWKHARKSELVSKAQRGGK